MLWKNQRNKPHTKKQKRIRIINMNLSSSASKKPRTSIGSSSMSSDQSGRRKAHKAKRSKSTKHVVVLPDGARLTKSKTKKHLHDGSLFIASKMERVESASSTNSNRSGDRMVKTETQRIRPDGYCITTTTTKTIDSARRKFRSSNQQNHATTKILPDGTRLVESTTRKLLPDGKIDTVSTTIRIIQPPRSDSSSEEVLNQLDLSSAPRNWHTFNIQMPPISETEDAIHSPLAYQDENASEVFPEVDYSYDDSTYPSKFRFDASSDESKAELPRAEKHNVSEPKPQEYFGKNITENQTKPIPSTVGAHPSSTQTAYKLFNPPTTTMRSTKGISHSHRLGNLEVDYCHNAPMPPEFVKGTCSDKTKAKMQEFCARRGDRVLEVNDDTHEPMPPEYVSNESVSKRNPIISKVGMKLGGIFSPHALRNDKDSISPCAESNRVRESESEDRDTMSSKPKSFHSSSSMDTGGKSKGRFSIDSIYRTSDDRSTKGSGIRSIHSVDTRSKATASGLPDNDIPVAKAVDGDEEGNRPVYTATEYDPFSKPPIYKNRRFRIFAALALLIICVVTIVVVVYTTREVVTNIDGKGRANETFSPTLPPTTIRDTLGIREHIESHVLPRNVTFKTMAEDDPRERAVYWLLHEDGMQLDTLDDNLSQRYIMALLAYSLDSEAWLNCSSYPSFESGMVGESNPETCVIEDNSTGLDEKHWSWLSSADECDWYGVNCVDGNVRWIELPDNDLIGSLAPEIGLLEYLEILHLSGNCIYGTIPPELGRLKFLKQLDLSYNGLSGNFPDELFDLTSLVNLDVGNQGDEWHCTRSDGELAEMMYKLGDPENDKNVGINGAIFDSRIRKLSGLRELVISQNSFSGVIASEIRELNRLEILNAGDNLLQGTIPNDILSLIKLKELWLEFNYFNGTLPSDIGNNLPNLEKLSIYSNGNITGSIPDSLYNLTLLKTLFLNDNLLTGTISSDIGNMKNLTYLALDHNSFSGTIPSELGLCEQLSTIDIKATNITGSMPEEVCLLREKNLYFQGYPTFFNADCTPDNDTNVAFFYCRPGCCQTCCDHITDQCVIIE